MVHNDIYSHIKSYEHLNWNHTKKRKYCLPKHTRAPINLHIPVGICVRNNRDTGPATQHKQVYFRLFVFGPFISPGVHKDHVFDVTSKFFRGKRFALKPWGQGVGSSRLVEPVVASVSKERFSHAFHSSTESFVAI